MNSRFDPKLFSEHAAEAHALILRYGRNATACQILNPGIRLWFSPGRESVLGYADCGGTRVVAGEPVGPAESMPETIACFEAEAAALRKRVCYFYVQEPFVCRFLRRETHSSVLLGAQPYWNPQRWENEPRRQALLKRTARFAARRRMQIENWTPEAAAADPAFRACLTEWQQNHGLPAMGFLVGTGNLGTLPERKIIAARQGDKLVGFITMTPVAERRGWLIEHIVRGCRAPNGTSEWLVYAAMDFLARSGAVYATLGLAPLSKRAGLSYGQNPLWMQALFAAMRRWAGVFYNFDGLDAFKAKFRPLGWEPVYAAAGGPSFSVRGLYAIAGAFGGMPPALFAAGALRDFVLQWF